MGKITVKHYLNTNLKAYLINGVKHYAIYLLISANRQNTKIKSLAFCEYYSEKEFKEIINSTDSTDIKRINDEISCTTTILELIINEFENFDKLIFSCIYNILKEIYVLEFEIMPESDYLGFSVNLEDKDGNSLNINLSDFFLEEFSLKENNKYGMSLYTYFSKSTQELFRKWLEKKECAKDILITNKVLNKIIFYKSILYIINSYSNSNNKKYKSFSEKLSNIENNPDLYLKDEYTFLKK